MLRTRFAFGRCWVRISAGTQVNLAEVFVVFLSFSRQMSGQATNGCFQILFSSPFVYHPTIRLQADLIMKKRLKITHRNYIRLCIDFIYIYPLNHFTDYVLLCILNINSSSFIYFTLVVPVLNQISTTPWRRMGEWMYRSTYSWPRHRLEVNGQLHFAVLLNAIYKQVKVIIWEERRWGILPTSLWTSCCALSSSCMARQAGAVRGLNLTSFGILFTDIDHRGLHAMEYTLSALVKLFLKSHLFLIL
jgi:hypothetical protein